MAPPPPRRTKGHAGDEVQEGTQEFGLSDLAPHPNSTRALQVPLGLNYRGWGMGGGRRSLLAMHPWMNEDELQLGLHVISQMGV